MTVWIPQPLRSYTDRATRVDAEGENVGALLRDLDRRFPGIRFRMVDEQDHVRRHIRIFVNGERTESLDSTLRDTDEVHIFQALSGG